MTGESIKRFFKSPGAALQMLSYAGLLFWLPDKPYIQLFYRTAFHRKLNLRDPKTYSEKIQWLKLYHRDPLYTVLSDKYAMRGYASEILGDDYMVPLLGIWDTFGEINFEKLPNQFVLKCTRDSGSVIICRDKTTFDKAKAKTRLEKTMKRNYYRITREWGYKNIRPRIIAEKYLFDENECGLKDYKFTCMNGEPRYLFTCQNRGGEGGLQVDAYNMQLQHLELREKNYANSPKPFAAPASLEKMLQICRTIAKPFPLIRIDLYDVCGRPYIGEFTFYPAGGLNRFYPEEWDDYIGSGLILPEKDSEIKKRSI